MLRADEKYRWFLTVRLQLHFKFSTVKKFSRSNWHLIEGLTVQPINKSIKPRLGKFYTQNVNAIFFLDEESGHILNSFRVRQTPIKIRTN